MNSKQRISDPDVKKEEFVALGDAASDLSAGTESRQTEYEERVFKQCRIPADRLLRNFCFGTYFRVIEPLPAEDGCHIQETGIVAQIPDQSFGADFFPEISLGVRVQYGDGILAPQVYAGQHSNLQRSAEVERILQFSMRQWIHVFQDDASRQEIRSPTFELARTGARQDEAEGIGWIVDERLHGIQQGRQALHLIDDNQTCGSSCRQLASEEAWVFCMGEIGLFVCQIDHPEWSQRSAEGRLSDLARPEKQDVFA